MAEPVTGPDAPFAVTFFGSHAATSKTERLLSLVMLAQKIKTTTAPSKEKLPWLKLATFGDVKTPLVPGEHGRMTGGSFRHDANVLGIAGVEADYDAEQVGFEEAVQRLTNAGVLGIVYTSPSHTEDRQRWRVLCPLTALAAPADRSKMLGRLNGLYRGIFSVESWTLSQSYYYGSVSSNPSHRAVVVDGMPLDQHDELDELWTGKPNTGSTTGGANSGKPGPVNEAELLAQLVSGESYHTAAVRLLGTWALHGVPLADAHARLDAAMEEVPDDRRDERWRGRKSDLPRCVLDIYGKEAGKKDAFTGLHAGQGERGQGRVQWGDPVDFLADSGMPAPTLETRHVPEALWPFIADTAKRMGVDPSCVALAALVSCSSVISDELEVQPKRNDYTWTEQARLWGAIVGDPSILKTPVISQDAGHLGLHEAGRPA